MSCTAYLHLRGTDRKKSVKRSGSGSLVGILTSRDGNREKLSKQTLDDSPVVASTSATGPTWRRPRSVTHIICMPSRGAAGRNDDDKLLLLPQNKNYEQQSKAAAAAVKEDTTSLSLSSESCGQEWDLTMHVQQLSADDDDNDEKSKQNNPQHCLVTVLLLPDVDVATAWVQMASPCTKTTDPDSTMTAKTSTTTAKSNNACNE